MVPHSFSGASERKQSALRNADSQSKGTVVPQKVVQVKQSSVENSLKGSSSQAQQMNTKGDMSER